MHRGDWRDVRRVGDEHPRPDPVREPEPGLLERPLDDPEDGPRLAGGVTGVEGLPLRAGVGRPGDERHVARDRDAAVAEAGLPRPATAYSLARHDLTTGSRPTSSRSAANSAVRGTIESTSRYSSGE